MEYLDFIQAWLGIFFAELTMARLGQILALGILASIGIAMYRIHSNKTNPVDFADLFVDPMNHKIDGSKLRMNLAFFVTSWVVVYSTLNASLSEWLFAGYLAAWVADRKFSRDSYANFINGQQNESKENS